MILVVSIFLSSNVLNLPQHIRFARSSKYNYNEAGKAMTLILQQSKSNHIGFSNIRLDIIHFLELSGLVHDSNYRFRFSTDDIFDLKYFPFPKLQFRILFSKFKSYLRSENYIVSFNDLDPNMIDFFKHNDLTHGWTMDTDGNPVFLIIQPGQVHIYCNGQSINFYDRSLEYQTWSMFGKYRKLLDTPLQRKANL